MRLSSTNPDDDLVRRVLAGDTEAFEPLMRRHNQRLFRAARAVLGEDTEAEDAVQEAYVRAFRALPRSYRPGNFGNWVLAIVLNEAKSRRRKQRRREEILEHKEGAGRPGEERAVEDPELAVASLELRKLVENAVDALPSDQRVVFILRELEQLSTRQTAEALELTEAAVRTRLHRGKAALREALSERIGIELSGAFAFAGARCDRIVSNVLERLQRRDGLAH